jgi:4-carboxymuconolactone decarboxylase
MRPGRAHLLLSLLALTSTLAIPASTASDESHSSKDIQMVAPALEKYTQNRLLGEVWQRPGLTLRDRSVVTVAALIGRNQTITLSEHLKLALDHGVKPAEISEIITHLAFYSGWANAMAAIAVTKEVFAERNITPDRLPAASPALLPLNEAAEADRAQRVGDQFGAMFPGVVQYTTDVLFRDLWLRPDLVPRDRSLVTISALIANGQVAQLTGHIPIGMNNGLSQPEIAEAITHLAFYVGWPNVFSAMPVAKEVFEKRAR